MKDRELVVTSEAVGGGGVVWVEAAGPRLAGGGAGAGGGAAERAGFEVLTPERRRELRRQLAAGDLDRLTFRAVTFVAQYPNKNFYRFRDADMPGFAASYAGVPFLRDHNQRQIEARGGTVSASVLEGGALCQTVDLTVPRDMEAFLNGQIDRFSIGWNFTGVTCAVCNADWLGSTCNHWPGRKYKQRGADGKESEVLCELIWEGPTGKEVSAVNAPAVGGTGVREVLAELAELKGVRVDEVDDVDGVDGGLTVGVPTVEAVAPAVGLVDAQREARELLEAQRGIILDARLATSGLPIELQDVVRSGLATRWTVGELDQAIGRAVAAWAKLEEKRTVVGMTPRAGGRLSGMLTSLDQVQLAVDGLVSGVRPLQGVRPLSGIRELYTLLSGDYEMHGMYREENVGLAAVDSSTMAGMVANALNKVIVNQFAAYPRWWESFCNIEDFTTLQQVKWITLGGVGTLPEVAEGAAYTEMTWDDQTETADWAKKGGYLGLTLEAIDKDDTRRLMQAGPALARAAWMTLGKSVSGIFTQTSGTGPLVSDGTRLFTAGHGNLGSTALSYAAWDATRLAMRKQAELNSGERLGSFVQPRFMLVPPDLETTAIQVMASEGQPGTGNNDENVYADGDTHSARMAAARKRVIVVDFWTDATDWAAVADPRMYPTIGLGFRFGRQPETFSVAAPNSGLMFTNDTMPIKVRFFFAVGPTDWRGLYKHNVAG